MEPLKQCAALAYVESDGCALVLLVTTRGRGRWTIPKGWPKQGIPGAETAAREAFEEGGVAGKVGSKPLGTYEYTKRLHVFAWIRCRVEVYCLHVDRQFLSWPEKPSRSFLWVELGKAAELVRERQLADVLRSFPQSGPRPG